MIDNVRPTELITVRYWATIPWEQLLILGGQLSVRIIEWQHQCDRLDQNTIQFFKARLTLKSYKRMKSALDEHLHTSVPHWMAEEANAYFNHIITTS